MKLKYIMALHVTASICIYSAEAELQAPKNRTAIFIISNEIVDSRDLILNYLLRAIGEGENPLIVSAAIFHQFANSVAAYRKCGEMEDSEFCKKIANIKRVLTENITDQVQKLVSNIAGTYTPVNSLNATTEVIGEKSLLFTNFNPNDWIIKEADGLVLLVPTRYIEKIGARELTGKAFDIQTGLKISQLRDFELTSKMTDTKKLDIKAALNKIFLTKEDTHEYDLLNYSWYFYLTGHGQEGTNLLRGNPEERMLFFDTLNSLNSDISNINFISPNNFKPEILIEAIEKYQSGLISKDDLIQTIYEQRIHYDPSANFDLDIQQLKSISTKIAFIKSKASDYPYEIAGMSAKSFIALLDFLNDEICTNFLYYSTCYGGGVSGAVPYVNKVYNYDIATGSSTNLPMSASLSTAVEIKDLDSNHRLVLFPIFTNFNNFFIQVIEKKTDLLNIIKTTLDLDIRDMQYVLIRYKKTQSFVPFIPSRSADKIIILNKKFIESHLALKQPIIINSLTMILVYVTFIPVDIILNSKATLPGTEMLFIPKIEGSPLVIERLFFPTVPSRNLLFELSYPFMSQENSLILIKHLTIKDKTYSNIIIDNNCSYPGLELLKGIDAENHYKVIMTNDDTRQTVYHILKEPSYDYIQESKATVITDHETISQLNLIFDRVYEKQVRTSNLSPSTAKSVAATLHPAITKTIAAKLDPTTTRAIAASIARKRAIGPIHTEQPS